MPRTLLVTMMFFFLFASSVVSAEVLSPSKVLEGHDTWVNSIAVFGNSLYSVSNDGSLIEWDIKKGKMKDRIFLDKVVTPVREFLPNIYTVAISESGRLYGITSNDGHLHIRERSSHKDVWKYKVRMENAYSLVFVGENKVLLGDISGTVTFLDLEKKEEIYVLDAHVDAINTLALSPDKKYFASVSNDSLVRIWDIETGKSLKTLKGHKDSVLSVFYSPDGKRLLTGSRDKTVRLWNIDNGESEVLHRDFSYVNEVAFSPDGRMAAYQDNMQNVTIKNLEYENVLFELKGHNANVKSILFANDGSEIYTCGSDSKIMIWNIRR